MYLTYFLKISWVDKNWNMVNITAESPIDTILVFNLGIFQFFRSQKNIHISFKNVAVNNVDDFRQIFDGSYISTKRVCIKGPPCGLTAFEE